MIYHYLINKVTVNGLNYYRTTYRGTQKLFSISKYGDEESYKMAVEYGEHLKSNDPESKDNKAEGFKTEIKSLEPFDIKGYFKNDVSFTAISIGSTKSGKTTTLIKCYEQIKDKFDLIIIFSVSCHKDIYNNFKKAILIRKFDDNLIHYLYTLNSHLAEKGKEMLKIFFILDDIVSEKNNKTLLEMICTMRNSNITTWISVQSPHMINEKNKNNFNFIFLHKMNDSKNYDEIIKSYFDGDLIEKYQDIPDELKKTVIRKREFIRKYLKEKTANYNVIILDILGGFKLYQNILIS